MQVPLSDPAGEITASPEGPQVGPFFDLDGTPVAGFIATAVGWRYSSVGRSARRRDERQVSGDGLVGVDGLIAHGDATAYL